MVMMRERERERKFLMERGLSFACQQDPSAGFGFHDDDGDQMINGGPEVNMVGGELAALVQELASLQGRLASLMEKMGSLPLDLIRGMRQEVVEVTDQLRNINRSHRRM